MTVAEVVPPIPEHKVVWMLDGRVTCLCGEVPPSADERDVRIHIEWTLDMQVKELTAALAALVERDPIYASEITGEPSCIGCDFRWGGRGHAPGCVWVAARALLGGES